MRYFETIQNYAIGVLGGGDRMTYDEGCDFVADTTRALGFMAIGGACAMLAMDRPSVSALLVESSVLLGIMTHTNRQNAQRARESQPSETNSQRHL